MIQIQTSIDTIIRIDAPSLKGANLRSKDLHRALLEGRNLSGADLSYSSLRGAFLENADLSGCNLSDARLMVVDLRNATLVGACLKNACLNGADLEGADLSNVDLSGADVGGASLRGARLSGATMMCSRLEEADLVGAIQNKSTRWPKGFSPLAFGVVEEDPLHQTSDSREGTDSSALLPGERPLTWSDASDAAIETLDALVSKVSQGVRVPLPAKCPICREKRSVRMYFDAPGSGKIGSYWVWCGACRNFTHGSIHPPSWWSNCPTVKRDCLDSLPRYLNTLQVEIDKHWNQCITPSKP